MKVKSVGCLVVALMLSTGTGWANWEVQETTAQIVRSDGLKAGADLGPARSAAVGHIDGDGVVDLVVGHASGEAGEVVIYFGNEAFREGPGRAWHRARRGEAPPDPFRAEALLIDVPFAPDWLAVGDFDADGANDVACAAHGRSELIWIGGDGLGSFSAPKSVALPGPATAMTSGEVNRRDATTDVVVAVEPATGAGLLVFEHPVGAFTAEPEWHPVAAPVTDIALGRLDGDAWIDIAAAADKLVVISGRDRKLGLAQRQQAAVLPAETRNLELETAVFDLAIGHFSPVAYNEQIAVRRTDGVIELVNIDQGSFAHHEIGLFDRPEKNEAPMTAADIAYGVQTDLIARSRIGSGLDVFDLEELKSGAARLVSRGAVGAESPLAVSARLNRDARDDLVVFTDEGVPMVVKTVNRTTYVVNSVADPGTGGCDATECTLREAIQAVNSGGSPADIIMNLPFVGATMDIDDELPWIYQAGVVIDGTAGSNPFYYPVTLDGQTCSVCIGLEIKGDAVLGGQATLTDLALVNWESDALILDSWNNLVEGCLIGLRGDLTADGNSAGGVFVGESYNTIGGTTSGARNIVSANNLYGIKIAPVDNIDVSGTDVQGNFIGTDASGNSAVENWVGVVMISARNTTIGTSSGISGGGNVISGNFDTGIFSNGTLDFSSVDLLVIGNHIGVGFDGVTALGNGGSGVETTMTNPLTVGGSSPGTRNVIADNAVGIFVKTGGVDTVVKGNFVGLGSDGATAVGNSIGIQVEGPDVTIGGDSAGLGNTVCDSSTHGVYVVNTHTVDVLGNLIGSNDNSDHGLGNASSGIVVENSNACVIGEDGNPDAENVVLASGEYGIWFTGGLSNQSLHNHIGVPGDPDLGTVESGIQIDDSTGSWVLGNTIAGSGNDGVTVDGSSTTGVWVAGNSISESADLAIDLNDDGVTANDPGDVDSGPNQLLNFPVLETADSVSGTVTGTLDTVAQVASYDVEFYENSACSPSAHGEAEAPLGTTTVVTDATGHGSFSETFPGGLVEGTFITALAIDPNKNTSELSACIEVSAAGSQEITIEMVSASYSVDETDPHVEVGVVMTTSDGEVSEAESSVLFETRDNTADEGLDYVGTTGTKVFAAGSPSGTVQTIQVQLIDDVIEEPDETFFVDILSPVGAVLGTQIVSTVTILDDDGEPPIFADGFESGTTSAWTQTQP